MSTKSVKKDLIHHLFILDESGSMRSVRQQTMLSFNELAEDNERLVRENPDQEHRFSFITFNSEDIKTISFDESLDKPHRLTNENYVPDCGTPLWDAVGSTVLKLKHHLYAQPEARVLVTIFTDGMENASREFTAREIKLMIEQLRKKNWVFTYMGTDHDIHDVADRMGIHRDNRMYWDKQDLHHYKNMVHESRRAFSDRVRHNNLLEEDLMKEAERRMDNR